MKQSMDKQSLGDRMKKYYEQVYTYKLPMRMPVIIRLDGRSFHILTRGMNKPFDLNFMYLMQETAKYLCSNIQGAELAYTQSDEISLLLHNYKRLNSQAWFGNEVQKMTSISAALASSFFSVNYAKDSQLSKNKLMDTYIQFDSRVFVLPEAEVCNYFIWRQLDWERNSIQMLGQSLHSHKDLQNKSNNQIQELCFQKGRNWNDMPTHLKRGSCIRKMATVGKYPKWLCDLQIPQFTKDRSYIENALNIVGE